MKYFNKKAMFYCFKNTDIKYLYTDRVKPNIYL